MTSSATKSPAKSTKNLKHQVYNLNKVSHLTKNLKLPSILMRSRCGSPTKATPGTSDSKTTLGKSTSTTDCTKSTEPSTTSTEVSKAERILVPRVLKLASKPAETIGSAM